MDRPSNRSHRSASPTTTAADHSPTQPNLFLRAVPAPRPSSPTCATLEEYRAAWERVYGRAWMTPSYAEAMRHARRLATLVEDVEVRKAYLAAYLDDRAPFLRRAEHALRYALTDPAFRKYRAVAEWAVAERRRIAAIEPAPRVVASSGRRFGRAFIVEARNRAGAVVQAFGLWAANLPIAERLARAWWLRDAPYGIHDVAVRPDVRR